MRTYHFKTCDVFTDKPFTGNQLAVFLDAQGLDDAEMQTLAAEINYAETAFVFPPDDPAHTARVRIFTPARELPFAGHPNVGTAHLMALDAIARGIRPDTMLFEEAAGLVEIGLAWDGERLMNTMVTAPQPLQRLEELPPELAARLAGVETGDLHPDWTPCVAASGVPFAFVEVKDREVLKRVSSDASAHHEIKTRSTGGNPVGVEVFCRVDEEDTDIRARMFAPVSGIIEDAATGSSNITLAGLLALEDPEADGELTYHIAQGVEMGRPSLLIAGVTKASGGVETLKIGGMCVPVFTASITL